MKHRAVKRRERGNTMRKDDVLIGPELRDALHQQLQNIGIVSAFMAALAGQIYAQPPATAPCYGAIGLKAIVALEWLAMGCFYLSIGVSVILSLDARRTSANTL